MAKNISGKTGVTGAAGTASGVGLAPLIIWVLALWGIDMDPATAAVAGGLISTVVTTILAWVVPAKSGKYVDTEPWVYEPETEESRLGGTQIGGTDGV